MSFRLTLEKLGQIEGILTVLEMQVQNKVPILI